MLDEDVDRLFQAAGRIGERFKIDLLGDDGVIPMRTFKLSDTEHVIHELSHVLLFGLDLNESAIENMRAVQCTQRELQLNEIQAFSVTMETLRRLGAGDEIEESTFLEALITFQLHGFEYPKHCRPGKGQESWVRAQLAEFCTTDRGKSVVQALINLFAKEGYAWGT